MISLLFARSTTFFIRNYSAKCFRLARLGSVMIKSHCRKNGLTNMSKPRLANLKILYTCESYDLVLQILLSSTPNMY